MRKILLIAMMCMSLGVSAQSLVKENSEYECFCEVMMTNDNKVMIFFTDTDDNEPFLICDSNGEPIVMTNEKAMLLYMSKRGWRYREKVMHDLHGPLISLSRKAYLMEKYITRDEQAKDFITTVPVANKKKKK